MIGTQPMREIVVPLLRLEILLKHQKQSCNERSQSVYRNIILQLQDVSMHFCGIVHVPSVMEKSEPEGSAQM